MKKTYFIWLAIHCFVWALAFFSFPWDLNEGRLASVCLFFIILFILPLFTEKPMIQSILFCIQALATIVIFYPLDHVFNPYILLIHALIIAEAVFYLSRLKSLVVIGVQLESMTWMMVLTIPQLVWYGLFYLLLVSAMLHYQAIRKREIDVRKKNDALLDEYRKMKRQLLIEEEQARLGMRYTIQLGISLQRCSCNLRLSA